MAGGGGAASALGCGLASSPAVQGGWGRSESKKPTEPPPKNIFLEPKAAPSRCRAGRTGESPSPVPGAAPPPPSRLRRRLPPAMCHLRCRPRRGPASLGLSRPWGDASESTHRPWRGAAGGGGAQPLPGEAASWGAWGQKPGWRLGPVPSSDATPHPSKSGKDPKGLQAVIPLCNRRCS